MQWKIRAERYEIRWSVPVIQYLTVWVVELRANMLEGKELTKK